MGRLVIFTPEKRDECVRYVLDEIAKGRALARVLEDSDVLPSTTTWFKWERDVPELIDEVVRARELGAATRLDEIIDIADDSNGDVYVEHTQDGTAVAKIDGDAIQRAKLRIYAREKYAQMIAPRRFGTKVDVTSGGEALPAPSVTNDNRVQQLISIALERKREDEELKRIMGD